MVNAWPWWVAAILNVAAIGALGFDRVVDQPTVIRLGCSLGIQSTCTELGNLLWVGVKLPPDRERALALYTAACDKGNARGCYMLGNRLSGWRKGWKPEFAQDKEEKAFLDRIQDAPKAEAILQKACDLGSGQACEDLARDLMRRTSPSARDQVAALKAEPRARALVERACLELTYQWACADLINYYRTVGDQERLNDAIRANGKDALPPALITWLTAVGLSLLAGIVFVRARKGTPAERQPRRWSSASGVMAAGALLLGLALFAMKPTAIVRLTAWAVVGLGVILAISALLIWKGRDRTARVILAVSGFLLLPLGLFAILVSREIAEARPGTPG